MLLPSRRLGVTASIADDHAARLHLKFEAYSSCSCLTPRAQRLASSADSMHDRKLLGKAAAHGDTGHPSTCAIIYSVDDQLLQKLWSSDGNIGVVPGRLGASKQSKLAAEQS